MYRIVETTEMNDKYLAAHFEEQTTTDEAEFLDVDINTVGLMCMSTHAMPCHAIPCHAIPCHPPTGVPPGHCT